METSIIESALTDNSKVYSVDFLDGSARASIHCVDQAAANALQAAILEYAAYAVIDGTR